MKISLLKNIKDQKGFSLLAVLVFVFILVTTGIALITMASNDIRLATLHRDSVKAFYTAEAGLSEAIYHIDQNWENYKSKEEGGKFPLGETTFGDGNYYVTSVKEDGVGVVLTSTGKTIIDSGTTRGRRIVEMTIGQISGGTHMLFDYAIAGINEIRLEDYMSGIEGDIYCDGNINNQGVTVNGSAFATGSVYGQQYFTGEIHENIEPIAIEYPPLEDFIVKHEGSANWHDMGGAGTETVISQNMELNGGIYYYQGDVRVTNNAIINGPGVIITEGTVKFETGSSCGTSTTNPVGIYSNSTNSTETSPAILFEDTSDIYGILYAPNGYIKVETNSTIYGSVISSGESDISVKVETESWVKYTSASDYIEAPSEYVPAVVAWREKKE